MKARLTPIIMLIFLSSCFALNHKMKFESKTDTEILEYFKYNHYEFDQLLRVNRNSTLTNITKYGITGIQFVNLYNKEGKLIKNESGDHCEINIMSYIKDSLKFIKEVPLTCDSCDYGSIAKITRRIYNKNSNNTDSNYKVVIGWAAFLNKHRVLKKRTTIVNKMIDEMKAQNSNVIVIGLNLDPLP